MRLRIPWPPALASLCLLFAIACNEGSAASPTSGARRPSAAPSNALSGAATLPRRLRRLSRREYDRVVHDLLGEPSPPASASLSDVYQNGYDNGSANLRVQSDEVAAFESAAEALAASAVRDGAPRVLGGCDFAYQGSQACLEVLLRSFAPRAFRRPLTATETARLRDVYAQASAEGFSEGIQTVLEVILQSPQFLYREELGPIEAAPSTVSSPGSVELTDYELASELSFLLTGSIPDDELWDAVQAGRFHTPADRRREAMRLLATPAAKDAMRAFLHQWMATDHLADLTKDPAVYPQFNAASAASMAVELDRFFDDVLWTRSASLRDLFAAPQPFVDVTDGQRRLGVMAHQGFLATHAASDSSGPISRGVFVLGSIMCSPSPPRPSDAPAAPPPAAPGVAMTTRQRFAQHASDPKCAACHTRIDGVGFGFEEFDGAGDYRETENGQPIDSRGTVTGTGEIDGDFQGVSELTLRLSGSRLLAQCYARQAYRYAMGQVEDPGEDMSWLTSVSAPDTSMLAVLLAIADSDRFVRRTVE